MTTPAEVLRRMADAIEANSERPFGGCMVIIPPAVNGKTEIIETLILDSTQAWSQFWGLLKAKADVALREAEQAERQGAAFGRR
jgi:hypothetical protein